MFASIHRPYGNFHHASPYPVSLPIPPPTISSPSASPRTVDSKSSRDYSHLRRISPNSEKSANSENTEKSVVPVSLAIPIKKVKHKDGAI